MIGRINGFKINGSPVPFVDERVEYFYNYWRLIMSEGLTEVLATEVKFESHRTLLDKIENQINNNFPHSFSPVKKILEHSYLQGNNILTKKKPIQDRLKEINEYCTTKKQYNNNSQEILKLVKKIQVYLLDNERYNLLLANNLVNILRINKKVTEEEKNNIKFLINAMIVELYHYGYSFKYIKKIPDIIIFRLSKEKFPYKRTLADFNYDKKAYADYIEKEQAERNLRKMLSGLINLIKYPKYPGYVIFKIDDVYLKEPSILKFGDVEFYNPSFHKKLNEDVQPQGGLATYNEFEKFSFADKPNNKPSNCNAITPINFRESSEIRRSHELIEAYQKVLQALEVITKFSKYYSQFKIKGGIKLDNHFFVHKDRSLAGSSLSILSNVDDVFETKSLEDKKELTENLAHYGNLYNAGSIGKKVYYILSVVCEIENREEFFSFNKLWTGWESIMPGEKSQDRLKKLIELTQSCMRIYIKNEFMYNIAQELEFSLNVPEYFNKRMYYSLNEQYLQEIGLSKGGSLKKFKNKYLDIKKYIDNEFVNFYLDKITSYINKDSTFFEGIDSWIENVLEEVYLERNMEVHKNIRSEFGRLKLKDDFIWLSFMLINEVTRNISSRNRNDFSQVITSIKKKANKL